MEMKELLNKYPFLIYKNIYSQEPCYKTEEENLAHNWYTAWEGRGWEKIWKRFMQEIFKEYDKLSDKQKASFNIYDTKEKYGTLRVSLSGYTERMRDLESILHLMSSITCQHCGKQPKDSKGNHLIWKTGFWIGYYCKECFKKEELGKLSTKHLSKKELTEYKEYERSCRITRKLFKREVLGTKTGHKIIYYKYNPREEWMEIDHIIILEKGTDE